MFCVLSCSLSLILVKIGFLVKKWHRFVDIKNGGGRHFGICTSVRTANLRCEFLVRCKSKIYVLWLNLTFKGYLLSEALMLSDFLLKIGTAKIETKLWVFFGSETL